MEEAPSSCGICQKTTQLSFKECSEHYTLWECPVCGGQFWDPMQSPGSAWYEQDPRYSDRNADPHTRPVITHRLFLRNNPAPNGALLDVGMGTGNFLNAARARGYKVTGLDFDQGAIDVAKKNFNLADVHTYSLEQYHQHYPQKYFDVMTFFEVIEHLGTPGIFIEEIKKMLKPCGYICISVPYRGAYKKFMGNDIPPRHLSRWNRRSMKFFLELHGFEVIKMKRCWVSLDFIITKFHFWTAGYLSFGLVRSAKLSKAKKISEHSSSSDWKIKTLFVIAKIKDYTLFIVPASLLYIYLIKKQKNHIGLFVIARKKN